MEYMMILPAKEENRVSLMKVLSQLFENNKDHLPRISMDRLNELTDHHRYKPNSTPFEIVLGWILRFWEKGISILNYLYTVLLYTEDFFTLEDVTFAVEFAELDLEIENTLQEEWNNLLDIANANDNANATNNDNANTNTITNDNTIANANGNANTNVKSNAITNTNPNIQSIVHTNDNGISIKTGEKSC
jgi:hypothetical protein